MRRSCGIVLGVAALAGVLACGAARPGATAGPRSGVIYQANSLYHRIFVERDGDVVTLEFGKRRAPVFQSKVDLGDLSRHLADYTQLVYCGLLYQPQPRRALLVGLGGGVIPRDMRAYFADLEIDVVEIDAEVLRVAERFFAFRQDPRLRVHVADGRVFIKRLLRRDPVPKYDLVILDAFNSEYIPFHLMTREFLTEVRGILADQGVVVANVFQNNRLFHAELATYLTAFGKCQVFVGANSVNAMLVALGPAVAPLSPNEAEEHAELLQEKHRFTFNLERIARQLRTGIVPLRGTQVLTDDRAPVNWLRAQEAPLSEGSGLPGGQ